jgi:hypothetical protein
VRQSPASPGEADAPAAAGAADQAPGRRQQGRGSKSGSGWQKRRSGGKQAAEAPAAAAPAADAGIARELDEGSNVSSLLTLALLQQLQRGAAGAPAGAAPGGGAAAQQLPCFGWTVAETQQWVHEQGREGLAALPDGPAASRTAAVADLFGQQQVGGPALRGLRAVAGGEGSRVVEWLGELGVEPWGLRLEVAGCLMELLGM